MLQKQLRCLYSQLENFYNTRLAEKNNFLLQPVEFFSGKVSCSQQRYRNRITLIFQFIYQKQL